MSDIETNRALIADCVHAVTHEVARQEEEVRCVEKSYFAEARGRGQTERLVQKERDEVYKEGVRAGVSEAQKYSNITLSRGRPGCTGLDSPVDGVSSGAELRSGTKGPGGCEVDALEKESLSFELERIKAELSQETSSKERLASKLKVAEAALAREILNSQTVTCVLKKAQEELSLAVQGRRKAVDELAAVKSDLMKAQTDACLAMENAWAIALCDDVVAELRSCAIALKGKTARAAGSADVIALCDCVLGRLRACAGVLEKESASAAASADVFSSRDGVGAQPKSCVGVLKWHAGPMAARNDAIVFCDGVVSELRRCVGMLQHETVDVQGVTGSVQAMALCDSAVAELGGCARVLQHEAGNVESMSRKEVISLCDTVVEELKGCACILVIEAAAGEMLAGVCDTLCHELRDSFLS